MSDNLLRLTKLEMTHFRCFRKMDKPIEFDPNLTVIVAKNGCGKTAVLDAIRISLGTFTRGVSSLSQANIQKADATFLPVCVGKGKGASYPVVIRAWGLIASQEREWLRSLEGERGRTTSKDARAITDFGLSLRDVVASERDNPELPIVAYYGTGRLWKAMEIPKGGMPIQYDFARESALAGYVDALTANSSYAQVKDWMAYASLVRANPVECDTSAGQAIAAQYSAIEKAVDELLKGTGFRTPHYNISIGDVALIEDRGGNDEAIVVPVSLTSDGIKAAFSLVADIAYRCVRLNPFYGADACKLTQGVVMIDEVDLFLHPAWQQRILPDLQRIFPKIQFVVTTHSPQVVSSVSQRCLRIVAEDGQITPVSIWTEGVESSRILRDVFGTDPYPAPNEWRQRVNRFVEAVDAGRWNDPDVKKEGEELSAKFTGRDTDFDMARFRIEEEEWERDHASN